MRRAVLSLVVLVVGCGPTASSSSLAAVNVGIGAALYVAAGGCKISGCPTNTRCNVVTERCDPVKCDRTSCGPDAICDEDSGKCLAASSASFVKPASSAPTTQPAIPTPLAGPNASP